MAYHALSASARPDVTPTQTATALIGATLIAFRVNRRPDQLAQLMGLAKMATALGAISPSDYQDLLCDLDRLIAEEVAHG